MARPLHVLGLNAFLHDSAAALLRDGEVIAFAEEERFARRRHTGEFPARAISWCLAEAGIAPAEVDVVAFSWSPWLGLPRRLLGAFHRLATAPGRLVAQGGKWRAVRGVPRRLAALGFPAPVRFLPHHECHAAAAFLGSPFPRAVVGVVDGAGEVATTSWYLADGVGMELLSWTPYPHSVGLVYGAVTEFLGFAHDADEGKTMGLAPWGGPALRDPFSGLLGSAGDGRIRTDLAAFDWGGSWWTPRFEAIAGAPRRAGESIESRHEDVAFAVQDLVERVVVGAATEVHALAARRGPPVDDLVFTGGVALNSVLNGKLLGSTPFARLHLLPTGGDAGTALGAALLADRERVPSRERRAVETPYLGPSSGRDECVGALGAAGLSFVDLGDAIVERAAEALAAGRIVGWFQGRMEAGPRALGNRSILADPREAGMKDRLNRQVKRREAFRPFGPAVRLSDAPRFFEVDRPLPHMLVVVPATEEGKRLLPAVVHVDGSARVQTVTAEENPRFDALLGAFGARTGVPVLLNTSLNVAGEPIAAVADDAVRTFVAGGLDALALGDLWVDRPGSGA